MRLAELQQAFWCSVRQRGAPPPGLNEIFSSSARQSADERLGVYHIAYWHRQLAALGATFPRTHALLAGQFERLAFGYIEAKPCREPCIEQLGAHFPHYLAERNDVSAVALGVAELEWAATAALLAKDSATIAALPRDLGPLLVDCRLELAPSLHVAHVCRASLDWLDAAHGLPEALDDSRRIDVAFYRPRFAVRHVALAEDEARACSLARGGATLGVVCSAFAGLPDQLATARALEVLGSWLARGWVRACTLERDRAT